MDRETTRRALLGAALGAGVAGAFLTPAEQFLRQFAPLSGSTWQAARWRRQSEVTSPYGEAELRYDDDGVPQIRADDEQALYFAAGYAQGTDRLFQLDFQRRWFSGTLSEVVGEDTVDMDRFHRKMQFREAAEVTVEHLRETAPQELVAAGDAFVDGVNAAIEEETLPLEFHLLDYEPDEWTLVDSILTEKIIGWGLTGDFRTLRKTRVAEAFDEQLAEQLYPFRFDGVTPIIREHHAAGTFGTDETIVGDEMTAGDDTVTETISAEFVDWVTEFEPPSGVGSNSWVVGPDLTDSDAPILGNDPHLQIQAPPIWYEMHLDGPNHRVRGVTFPGVPFVVIGENDHGAWGFTNAGADVIDFFEYDTDDDGETYEYRGEQREFEIETDTIEVAGGSDVEIERKRSVHGPVVEESGFEVGISWTGHAATETTTAIYELTHSTRMEEAREAISQFDVPTQNFLYADQDGNTLYQMTGRVPRRPPDHEPAIFDGSAGENEWEGFEPFSRPPAWEDDTTDGETGDTDGTDGETGDTDATGGEAFVSFEENPHVRNPTYLATANQQIVPDDKLGYYLSAGYAPPYRGERVYELLDERIESGEAIDLEFLREVGRDTYDGRAAELVGEPPDDGPSLVAAARASDDQDLQEAAELLEAWDYHMEVDSEAALVFAVWFDEYRDAIFEEPFDDAGLDEEYYPSNGAISRLPPDSRWFGPGGRGPVMRRALRVALERIDDEDLDTYGDYSHTGHVQHPTELDFLSYPEQPRSGTGETLWNYSVDGQWGGAWEMQADLDGELIANFAGGNSGRYFSDHYDDQVERWAAGDYRTLSRTVDGELVTEFTEGQR